MRKIDRNNKTQLKKDIAFLKEMLGYIEKAPKDRVTYEHLETMMEHWKDELEKELIKHP